MTTVKQKRTKVAIYLLKNGLEEPESFLIEKTTGIELGNIGTLYKNHIMKEQPDWAKSFFPGEAALKNLNTAGAGAILNVKADTSDGVRHFLISFGYGYHNINTGACVERFGLKVAINAGDVLKIRAVDKRNFSSTSKQSREQLAVQDSIQSFSVDFEQDMMQNLTIKAVDKSLGQTITGGLNTSFTTSHTSKTIKKLLPDLYKYYKSQKYKEDKFEWIDNINKVSGVSLKRELDAELVGKLNTYSEDDKTIVVCPPDILTWEDVRGFSPFPSNDSKINDEIVFEDYLKLDAKGVTKEIEDIDFIKKRLVHMWSGSADVAVKRWSLYKCIIADLSYNNNQYILVEGVWYQVEQKFAKTIDTWFKDLDFVDLAFPLYEKIDKLKDGKMIRVHDEGAYNEKVALTGYELLDKKTVNSGQYKDIEVCDLYKDKNFIHIKIFSGSSSPVSHLLGQATVSSELFIGDTAFRRAFSKKLSKENKLTENELLRSKGADYKITLAIVTNKDEPHLPFFSKINLRATIHRLELIGFTVQVSFVKGDFS